MALRNPETIYRLLDRINGNLVNLKLLVKTQQPVDQFLKKIEQTEEITSELTSTLDREGSVLRNG
jgi:flagellin-specific chaperone FliS